MLHQIATRISKVIPRSIYLPTVGLVSNNVLFKVNAINVPEYVAEVVDLKLSKKPGAVVQYFF